jgi:exosortase A-associated hydrolase 2
MPSCLSRSELEPAPDGYRFVTVDRPHGLHPRGTIVFSPPFAEEMNKSRRMAAITARALAAEGWCVVRGDLLGCGDSSGDFSDASWSDWIDDLRRLVNAHRAEEGELWLWALRAGSLLLPPLLEALPHANLLLWQPALSGSVVLTQFLRIKTMGAVTGAADTIDRKSLQESLARGETVEVAGYCVSKRLTTGLDAARFQIPASHRGRIVWFEISAGGTPALSPPASRLVDQCRQGGQLVHVEFIDGPQFWQTAEISELPALIERTLMALAQSASHDALPEARAVSA